MLGFEGVRRAVHSRLVGSIEEVASVQRKLHGYAVRELPIPRKENIFSAMQPATALGEFPIIEIEMVETGQRSTTRDTTGTGDYDEYEFLYRVRLHITMAGDSLPETLLIGDRISTVVRMTMLGNKILFESPDERELVKVRVANMREQRDEPRRRAATFLQTSILDIEIEATEVMAATPGPWELFDGFKVSLGILATPGVPDTGTVPQPVGESRHG